MLQAEHVADLEDPQARNHELAGILQPCRLELERHVAMGLILLPQNPFQEHRGIRYQQGRRHHRPRSRRTSFTISAVDMGLVVARISSRRALAARRLISWISLRNALLITRLRFPLSTRRSRSAFTSSSRTMLTLVGNLILPSG